MGLIHKQSIKNSNVGIELSVRGIEGYNVYLVFLIFRLYRYNANLIFAEINDFAVRFFTFVRQDEKT